MVVDDDSDVLLTLAKLLQMWGYEPVLFESFEDARASLAQDAPDGLVVDVRLGSYNGLQLALLAKQLHPAIAVIAVSGYDDPVLREEAAEAGAAYLLKPLDVTNFRAHLSSPS